MTNIEGGLISIGIGIIGIHANWQGKKGIYDMLDPDKSKWTHWTLFVHFVFSVFMVLIGIHLIITELI